MNTSSLQVTIKLQNLLISHHKWYRHDRLDCHTNSKPLPTELNPNENKKPIRNLSATVSVELNQYSYNGSFSYFEGLSFQVQIEKKQRPFTLT